MIKLGSKVRDMISGFTGIATGRSEFLYGCTQVSITPQRLDKDGKRIDVEWFDEQRVETIEERSAPMSEDNSATSGGPQDTPPSRRTPR